MFWAAHAARRLGPVPAAPSGRADECVRCFEPGLLVSYAASQRGITINEHADARATCVSRLTTL